MYEKYIIKFYEDAGGRCEILEFIDELPKGFSEKIFAVLDILKDMGPRMKRPHVDYLRDHIYELRIVKNLQIRLLFFYFLGNEIIFTHGFVKKTNAVPAREIEKAIEIKKRIDKNML